MRKRVLIAEDNPINLELVRQILEDDYDLLCASDGERAIELATAEAPDVILMDLSLPRVDGWEATRRLRDDPRAAAIPVMALTAHAIKGYRERALAAGFASYLTKPVDEDELLAEVARLAGRSPATNAKGPSSSGDPALAAVVREHLPRLVGEATAALDRGDLRGLADVAHQLKGGAQMAALLDIGALAGELEAGAAAGDLARCVPLLDAIVARADALV